MCQLHVCVSSSTLQKDFTMILRHLAIYLSLLSCKVLQSRHLRMPHTISYSPIVHFAFQMTQSPDNMLFQFQILASLQLHHY